RPLHDDSLEVASATSYNATQTRSSTLEDHVSFLNGLRVTRRLPMDPQGPQHANITQEGAIAFVQQWMSERSIESNTYFERITPHTFEREIPTSTSYWIECVLSDHSRILSKAHTAAWQTAYHGTNTSCLHAILQRRGVDTGPNGKCSNNYGKRTHFGVYCHKHGTRMKAQFYMNYFQYTGFISAPLLHLRVKDPIACGDQWCCDPVEKTQLDTVWIHIVPNASVYHQPGRYHIYPRWQADYELAPYTGEFKARYRT
ncbi:MAG: hypothetical protein NZ807_02910, partial [Dehalococcoidia bacterium]|nr:hypothetical protein [Dehalococcoidia bacterium]